MSGCLCLTVTAAFPVANEAEGSDYCREDERCQSDGKKGTPKAVESHAL